MLGISHRKSYNYVKNMKQNTKQVLYECEMFSFVVKYPKILLKKVLNDISCLDSDSITQKHVSLHSTFYANMLVI